MNNRDKTIESILGDLAAIKRILISHGHHMTSSSNITPAQSVVLGILRTHEGVGIKEIASLLGMTSSAATQLVDGLVENGYLVRESSPDDRRAVKLSLSKASLEQMKIMKKEGVARMKEIFTMLSDEELAEYAKLNKKIAEGVIAEKIN